ncbi:MAG: hypothetical protein LBG59_00915 [Candidatus Peribacteria bacterium]|jgi:hypothetical protein|nr:hypothetical protein [Candidatus Peribacteria bacterium]
MTFNSNQESQPAVEYRAVCRNLPANAHWTDGSTRKEIPQMESSPNVWTPSPVGTYDTSASDTECHFVCDGGYAYSGGIESCVKAGIPCGGTIAITGTNYVLADCNV